MRCRGNYKAMNEDIGFPNAPGGRWQFPCPRISLKTEFRGVQ